LGAIQSQKAILIPNVRQSNKKCSYDNLRVASVGPRTLQNFT